MANKCQLQKRQTREKIMAAAIKIYSEQRFPVPATAIADKAPVSRGSIFVHLPAVESLLMRLLDHVHLPLLFRVRAQRNGTRFLAMSHVPFSYSVRPFA